MLEGSSRYAFQSGVGVEVPAQKSWVSAAPFTEAAALAASANGIGLRNSPAPPRMVQAGGPLVGVVLQLKPKRGLSRVSVGSRSLRRPNAESIVASYGPAPPKNECSP